MQRSALCRSWRELSNAYFLGKFGFDTAENEPCVKFAFSSNQRQQERRQGQRSPLVRVVVREVLLAADVGPERGVPVRQRPQEEVVVLVEERRYLVITRFENETYCS